MLLVLVLVGVPVMRFAVAVGMVGSVVWCSVRIFFLLIFGKTDRHPGLTIPFEFPYFNAFFQLCVLVGCVVDIAMRNSVGREMKFVYR